MAPTYFLVKLSLILSPSTYIVQKHLFLIIEYL